VLPHEAKVRYTYRYTTLSLAEAWTKCRFSSLTCFLDWVLAG